MQDHLRDVDLHQASSVLAQDESDDDELDHEHEEEDDDVVLGRKFHLLVQVVGPVYRMIILELYSPDPEGTTQLKIT